MLERITPLKRPMVIAPTFYSNYACMRMARNYWGRFASLRATPGIHVIDLLPHFRRQSADAGKCFREPYDAHFSVYGHLVLAETLYEELTGLNLLPASA